MLYLTCTMISSMDFAHNGLSCAKIGHLWIVVQTVDVTVNGYTFMGSNSFIFSFTSLLNGGKVELRICSLKNKVFQFRLYYSKVKVKNFLVDCWAINTKVWLVDCFC